MASKNFIFPKMKIKRRKINHLKRVRSKQKHPTARPLTKQTPPKMLKSSQPNKLNLMKKKPKMKKKLRSIKQIRTTIARMEL